MSGRACKNFEESGNEEFVEKAKEISTVAGLEDHPSLAILKRYAAILETRGLDYLQKKLKVDGALISSKYLETDGLPAEAKLEIKTIEVVERLFIRKNKVKKFR
ncbi:hypothetical protein BGX26_005075 [Mortierella sp. AD094]|nr:hypothetical protein BGX26_005075 [Mortierella sp. AD094]